MVADGVHERLAVRSNLRNERVAGHAFTRLVHDGRDAVISTPRSTSHSTAPRACDDAVKAVGRERWPRRWNRSQSLTPQAEPRA